MNLVRRPPVRRGRCRSPGREHCHEFDAGPSRAPHLDHFKAFNDRRGHQAGDRLLREATAAWRDALREVDLLARYGGEEFGVILPGCRPDETAVIIDRLRALTPDGETTLAGVACWAGAESADALVARTDRALYRAKRGGRDVTVVVEASAVAA